MDEYLHVLTDPAHLFAELTFVVVIDILIIGLLWPAFKKWVRHHDRTVHGEHKDEPEQPEPAEKPVFTDPTAEAIWRYRLRKAERTRALIEPLTGPTNPQDEWKWHGL